MAPFKVLTRIAALFAAAAGPSHGFVAPSRHVAAPASTNHADPTDLPPGSASFVVTSTVTSSTTGLRMAEGDDDGGGILTKAALVGVLVVFLITSILPFLSEMQDNGPANLSGAVATRDAPDSYKGYESSFDRLSRAKIQEKLSRAPAFYLVDKATGTMAPEIYASYENAVDASKAGNGFNVKATTLDQVMYTLVLQRGRMMMPPPPSEVAKAEEALRGEDGAPIANGVKYKLIPSTQAQKSATEFDLKLDANDLPLFVADRLAFAGSGGAQVPLFFEKEDAISSYQRLQQQSGSKLPAEPKIRATSLVDQLNAMEKGTRPGVKQLEFYAAADDLMRADALMGN